MLVGTSLESKVPQCGSGQSFSTAKVRGPIFVQNTLNVVFPAKDVRLWVTQTNINI